MEWLIAAKPVVLLHAFPFSPEMWAPQVAELEGRYTVYAPALPGFGGREPGAASLEAWAEELGEALDDLGFEEAVFVGLSMGGYLAFRVWDLFPERVAGLVLADTRAQPDDAAGKAKRAELAARVRSEGTGVLVESFVPSVLGPGTLAAETEEKRAVVEWVERWVREADPEGVARALEALAARPDSRPLLGEIEVPTLVLVGEDDALTPPADARAMAAAIPDAELLILPGAGHMANLESPEAFNTALLGFLEKVYGG
ncbi:alpha/beta fold hydrolase [Oceanithermus sp.]|uniref:alpha/beta fold hydrolase n=1 Tax=Oceanithermus sp. TaxID=2268145 RepID=UPI00257A2EDB|nr:alpha/beta fold hydrolase [Oceanithermus sp.]